MTDLLEVRARRTHATLELTILDHSLDVSTLERLQVVLASRDPRTRRLGLDRRLRGFVLGLLVDCAARNQLDDKKSDDSRAFVADFVRTQYADPDGDHADETFDPESFAVPDDGETPESVFVLDHFVRSCELTVRHDPGRARAAAAFASAGHRWRAVPDTLRRHFILAVEPVSASLAALFADATWWTAYTL